MDSDTPPKDSNDSNVSCFALDGVVAEMVIDIDVDESPQKSLKLTELPKLKEETSQQPKPTYLFSEADEIVDGAMDSKKEKRSTSKLTTSQLANSESRREKIVDIDEDESLDSLPDLENSLKEDELKKSIFSDLNQIRRAAELSDKNEDNIPADEEKEHEFKRMPKSELSLEKETVENVLPTSISTRGNKRKLAEIEDDNENKEGLKKKRTNVENDAGKKRSLKMRSQSSFNSERINLKSWDVLRPKMYDLFEKDSRLKNFLHLRRAMNEVDLKFTRQFYRVIFDKWAPNDVAQMKAEILKFSGFPFDQSSDEVLKRKHILKKLPELALRKICYLLDLPRGKTDNMIFSILKFLHKPTKNVLCRIDPFQSCMQPFVKLDKLSFEYKYLEEEEEPSYSLNQQIKKIGRPPKKFSGNKYLSGAIKCSQIVRKKGRPPNETISQEKVVQKSVPATKSISTPLKKPVSVKDTVILNKKSSPSNTGLAQKKSPLSIASTSGTRNVMISKKVSKLKDVKLSVSSKNKSEVEAKKTTNLEKAKGKIFHKALKGRVKKKSTFLKSVQKKSMKRKIKKLKKEISELKVKVDETFMQAKGNAENGAILPSFRKEKENMDTQSDSSSSIHQNVMNEDCSSEVTLSADENVEEPKKEQQVKKKKKKMMRCGKPLRTFADIRNSIQNGNFSALQRLHILLFGASDKPENLKANILAFGGFPFLEGSDEWKQKEFLLSLLSLSTLKEYSNLLCIDHAGDDQQTLINKLMKFLAAPGGSSSEIEVELIEDDPVLEMKTKVVRLELAQPIKLFEPQSHKLLEPQSIKIVDAKSIAKKKVVKKKETGKGKGHSHRKVLMSEAEVRRLEADIKREQRIRDREKRLNDQLAIKRSMSLLEPASKGQVTPTLQKNIVLSQASSVNEHRTPLGTSVFLPISTTGTEISGSTSNYQAVATNVQKPPSTAAVKKTYKTTPKVPLPAMVKQADAEQLNALLQTVYKRRALKASGATISTLKTGESSKLGDLPNVKFLVVTANYSDLDVLHHLIYMTDAAKPKVRKNILDFAGFGFNEDSQLYKDRMQFLNSLGYDISKRIAFLLGLCPYKTNIDKQDLNELIMYFLMSPCKTKQVPITHLPQTFFSKNMPEELCMLMQKHSELEISPVLDTSNNENTTENSTSWLDAKGLLKPSSPKSSPAVASNTSISKPQSVGPKAKKSLPSASKKISLPPSASTIPFKDVASLQKPIPPVPKINTDTSTYALQKAILKTGSLPEPVTSPQEFLVQQMTPDGKQKTYKLIKLPVNHPLTSVIKPQLPISTPSLIQAPPVQINVPSSVSQTLPVQIPTPNSIIQAPPVQTSTSIIQAPSVHIPTPTSLVQTPPVSLSSSTVTSWNNPPGMALPPGLIIFKDKNNPPLAITTSSVPNNNLPTVPIVFGQQNPIILPQNILTVPSQLKTNTNVPTSLSLISNVSSASNVESILSVNVSPTAQEESISSGKDSKTIKPVSTIASGTPIQEGKTATKSVSQKEVFGASKRWKDRPPTNDELYSSIQKIILNADPEQITLRNVIDGVSQQYPGHNLKPRHLFMKDCVKKIILEST